MIGLLGWSMADEASTTMRGQTNNFMAGHDFARRELGVRPVTHLLDTIPPPFFKMAPHIVIRDVFCMPAPLGAGCNTPLDSRFNTFNSPLY